MAQHRQAQKGAALLVAMVVLTLVSTLAAGMVWQQRSAIQVEGAERARAQAAWILSGAMNIGRVLLRIDARTPGSDNLTEVWAAPLTEVSLSSLLAQDRNNNVDVEGAPEAFLSGGIRDAQSRYNLRNLVDGNFKLVATEVAALKRLCETAAVAPETAETIADGLQAAWKPANNAEAGSSNDAPLAPDNVEQLTWLGLDVDTVARLQRYVVLLPTATPLNVNTATAEVLSGVVAGLDAGNAKRIENQRPFKTLEDARAFMRTLTSDDATLGGKRLDVASSYFEISGTLRMDGRKLEERLLVMRRSREVIPLSRTRRSVPDKTG
jgi:general secretion pathway protein K